MAKKSVFGALKNWVRGKQDDMAEAMSDASRDGKFAIEDSEKQIAKFTSKIAHLMAETKRLEREQKEAASDVEKWQRVAKKAAQAQNMDDAREALEKKQSAEQRDGQLAQQVEQNRKLTTALRDQLSNARAKVAKARSDLTSLNARLEGAKVRKELAKAASDFNAGDSPLAALDDLEKAVTAEETDAESWEELTEDSSDSLEEKYDTGGDADIDAELAALMAGSKKD